MLPLNRGNSGSLMQVRSLSVLEWRMYTARPIDPCDRTRVRRGTTVAHIVQSLGKHGDAEIVHSHTAGCLTRGWTYSLVSLSTASPCSMEFRRRMKNPNRGTARVELFIHNVLPLSASL